MERSFPPGTTRFVENQIMKGRGESSKMKDFRSLLVGYHTLRRAQHLTMPDPEGMLNEPFRRERSHTIDQRFARGDIFAMADRARYRGK
jgi:hypothetical protein